MKPVRLYEEFINEGMFRTYNEIVGYELDKFKESYLDLHPNNVITYDKADDVTYGYRKGSSEAHWRLNHSDDRLHHDLKDRDVLGLINFKKMVAKNHPWSK